MRNWLKKQPRKRVIAHNSILALQPAENLEQRVMLSTVMDHGAEISHFQTPKAAASNPNITGTWLLQVEGSAFNLTNFPVTITQQRGKYTLTGTAEGYSLSITGKFAKDSSTTLSGKGTLDIPKLGMVKVTLATDASLDGISITGSGTMAVAGASVKFDLTGTRQLSATSIPSAKTFEAREKLTDILPNLAGHWVYQISGNVGNFTLNGSIVDKSRRGSEFAGSAKSSALTFFLRVGVTLRARDLKVEAKAGFDFAEFQTRGATTTDEIEFYNDGTRMEIVCSFRPSRKSLDEY